MILIMLEYEFVVFLKCVGEDVLWELIFGFIEKGIGFIVVLGDMIEGIIMVMFFE